MDLFCVIMFLTMYYLRPQEWFVFFNKIHFAQLIMITALWTVLFRERRVPAEGHLFSTPHDWCMLLFWMWIVFASPTPYETFKETYSLPITYFIVTQILYSVPRLKRFVTAWTVLILVIAALAVLSEHGFDPRGSYDITHGRMQGRLVFNLSIFKNPNALGHNVVPVIAMLYYLSIWKRPLFMKEVGFAIMAIPLYCIYLTVSKGAFLVGAGTVFATLTFGRAKTFQIIMLSLAFAMGTTAIWALPRMTELTRSKTDEAIQGRVAAFKHGLKMIETQTLGIGYGQWLKSFKEAHHYNKAAHSSYVQMGAELGKVGFAIFLAICYCNLRTLITARTATDDEERIRRILFVIVVSFMASSWMVDFGYRPVFFMMTAAVAAFHRHLAGIREEQEREALADAEPNIMRRRARLLPVPGTEAALATGGPALLTLEAPAQPLVARRINLPPGPEPEPVGRILGDWRRLGWLDVALILVLTWGMIRLWHLIVQRM